MTRISITRQIRNHFAKNGKRLDPLPLNIEHCKVCNGEMLVADGSTASFHSCCRKFRNNSFEARIHIEEKHA